MALRGTLTHRKTRRLAKALSISPCFALGVLEALWHVTAEQCPDGAIGRITNQDIADEMFYRGDADRLIEALVEAEFLDESSEHRLVIHDWSVHADQATKRKLARHGKTMVGHVQSCLVMSSTPEPESRVQSQSPEIPPNPRKRGIESNRKPTRRERQRDDETVKAETRRQLDADRKRQQDAAGAESRAEWNAALKLWGGLTPEQQDAEVAELMKQPKWKLAGVDLAREFAIRSMLKRSN